LLKSIDSNSTLRARCGDGLGALDRLHVEGRDDLRQIRHVCLGKDRGRQHGLAEQAACLLLAGIAAGAPETFDQLAREAVGAADAERHRAVHGIDPADRLVGEVVALPVLADDLRPFLRFLACAHPPDPMRVG
jgi:hypothetical protein